MIYRLRLWLWERKRRALVEDAECWRKAVSEADEKYVHAPRAMATLAFMLWETAHDELERCDRALERHDQRRPVR